MWGRGTAGRPPPRWGHGLGTCLRWSGTCRNRQLGRWGVECQGRQAPDARQPQSRASAAPPLIPGVKRGPPGPPRSPTLCVPPPAEKGALLAPRCPTEGAPGAPEAPALAARLPGTPASRGRGFPAPGGRRVTADAGAPTCKASLAMSLRRPPGVPAPREGGRGGGKSARAPRAGRGWGGRGASPPRRAALSGLLRSGPAWPGRRVRSPRPPAPAAAGPGHVTAEVGARGGGGAEGARLPAAPGAAGSRLQVAHFRGQWLLALPGAGGVNVSAKEPEENSGARENGVWRRPRVSRDPSENKNNSFPLRGQAQAFWKGSPFKGTGASPFPGDTSVFK